MQRSPFGEGDRKATRGASMRSAAPSDAERAPAPWRVAATSAHGQEFGPGAMPLFVVGVVSTVGHKWLRRPSLAAQERRLPVGSVVLACAGGLSSPVGDGGSRPASGCRRMGRCEWSSACPRRRARLPFCRPPACIGRAVLAEGRTGMEGRGARPGGAERPLARITAPGRRPRLRASTVAVVAYRSGRARHRVRGAAIRSR